MLCELANEAKLLIQTKNKIMKKISLLLTLAVAILMTSCGGGTFDSKYFGKAPGVLNKNLEEFLKMSKDNITSSAQYEKYSKQVEAFSKEIKEAMPDPFVEMDVEAEVSDGLPYKITKAAIVKGYVSSGNDIGKLNYKISMSVCTTDEMLLPHTVDNLWLKYKGKSAKGCAYGNICYKFVDSKGDVIDQGKGFAVGDYRYRTVGTRFNSKKERIDPINLPAGEQIDIEVDYYFGDFSEKELAKNIKKADLDKVVFITEEEFDKNQEILNQQKAAK